MPPKGLVAARLAALNQQEQQAEAPYGKRPSPKASRCTTWDLGTDPTSSALPNQVQPNVGALAQPSLLETSPATLPAAATHEDAIPGPSSAFRQPFASTQQQPQPQPGNLQPLAQDRHHASLTVPGMLPPAGTTQSSSQLRSDSAVGDSIVQNVTQQDSFEGQHARSSAAGVSSKTASSFAQGPAAGDGFGDGFAAFDDLPERGSNEHTSGTGLSGPSSSIQHDQAATADDYARFDGFGEHPAGAQPEENGFSGTNGGKDPQINHHTAADGFGKPDTVPEPAAAAQSSEQDLFGARNPHTETFIPDDSFGELGDFPHPAADAHPSEPDLSGSPHQPPPSSSGGFGHFDSFSEHTATAHPSGQDISSTFHQEDARPDDSFGNFEDLPEHTTSKAPLHEDSSGSNQHDDANADDAGFGAFDDGFGDFDEAPEAIPAGPPLTEEDEADEFGDFGEPEAAAQPAPGEQRFAPKDAAAADDDGFADFEGFEEPSKEATPRAPAAATASSAAATAATSRMRFVHPGIAETATSAPGGASEVQALTWKGSRAEASLLARAGLTDIAAQADSEAALAAAQPRVPRHSSLGGDWGRSGRPPMARQTSSAFAAAVTSGPADQPAAGKEPNSIFANSGAVLQADYFGGGTVPGADQQSTPSAAIREVSRMPSQRASGLPGQEAPAVQPDAAQASSPFHTPPGSGVSSPAPASPLPVSTATAKGSVSSSPEQQAAAASTAPSIAESSAAAVKSKKAIPPPPAAASPSPQLSLEAATAASVDADALKAEVRRQMEASLGFTGRTASGRSKPAAAEILGPPMEPVGAAPTDMSDWQPDFADAWMDAPAPAPTSASAGPSPAALVSVMSLDPFADMAPLMPESSWPAAALDPFAEALQPAPTAAAATPAAIPAAPVDKLATSPTGASDDGFGSFNEAAAPGSFFPASPVATLGQGHDQSEALGGLTGASLAATGPSSPATASLSADDGWATLGAAAPASASAPDSPFGPADSDFDDFLSGGAASAGKDSRHQPPSRVGNAAASRASLAHPTPRPTRSSLQLEPEILAGLGRPRSQRPSRASKDMLDKLPEVPDLSFMLSKTLQRPHVAYDSIL
ncbi:hypothetical protein WJX84_008434 [Apatococcus fuscideae]|uniref:Aftiphilin n=1 Tax=Apatococcus fuscideae TaxID=2026836 RepID=A0AAW1TA30_9CHLO